MRAPLIMLMLVAAALAGCSGKGSDPQATADSTAPSASSSTAPEEMGGIEGLITDEAGLPLADIEVLLRPGDQSTRTDAAGGFYYVDLAPGEYELWVGALGYDSVGRAIQVTPGDPVQVTITLAPVAVIVPYTESFTFAGYITAGEAFVDILTGSMGLPGCDECNQEFHANETVLSVVLELDFTPTLSNPTGTTTLEYQLWDKAELESGDLEETPYASGAWTHGSKIQLDKDQWESKWDAAGDDFHMVHYCATEWVCLDQRFTVYGTMFHHAEAPADFTALETDEP